MIPHRRIDFQDKIAALRASELFDSLSDEIVRKTSAIAVSRHLRRGELLYSEHEEAVGVFVVARGEVTSVRDDGHGKQLVLSVERPGDVLAAPAVFSIGRYYCSAIAERDSDVLCIHAEEMRRLCSEHPGLLWNLAKLLGRKVNQHAELLEALAFRSVEQRVAEQLLSFAAGQAIDTSGAISIHCDLTRTELASRVAATREAVTRALAHLRDLDLIEVEEHRVVRITRPAELKTFARYEMEPNGAR